MHLKFQYKSVPLEQHILDRQHLTPTVLWRMAYLLTGFRSQDFNTLIFNIKQTNTMQMGSDLYYCTSWLLYMFRAPLAPIIRSTTTVYAASGTSHTSDNRLPTWPSLNSEFKLCHVGRRLSEVWRARGCIYSCCAPDDGCKRRPKHVEQSRSAVIKVTAQLHRVGLFNI